MGLFSNAISQCASATWTVRMAQKGYNWFSSTEVGQNVIDSMKDRMDDMVQTYTAKISSDEWDKRINNVSDITEDTPDDKLEEYNKIAENFKTILQESDDKWSNIIKSVESNPAQWGSYLSQQPDFTDEKLHAMFGSKELDGSGVEVAKMSVSMSAADPNASIITKISNHCFGMIGDSLSDNEGEVEPEPDI